MGSLEHLLDAYGYAAIFVIIALENVGLPLPGETILIAAGIYAGETHRLNAIAIVLTATVAAFLGGIGGFAIGQFGERRFIHQYARYIHVTEADLRLGRYLFRRFGGRVVFFGRFVAFLRALSSLLAGINGMDVRRFLLFTGLGATAWAAAFGFGSYALGRRVEAMSTQAGFVIATFVGIAAIAGLRFLQLNRTRFQREADRAAAHNK